MAILMGIAITQPLWAQQATTRNLIHFDEKKVHYGFQLGLFQGGLKTVPSDSFYQQDTFYKIQSESKTGFSLGVILNFALPPELLDFRFTPAVSFYEHSINFYNQQDSSVINKSQEVTSLDFPLLLKYKSQRRHNHRVYVIGGFTPGIQVSGKHADSNSDEQVPISSFNLEASIGIGMNLYLQMFNLAPEVRFSHNLNNMFSDNYSQENIYAPNLKRIMPYRIAFILNFEG
ncbi:outer membrane beta-barrel protein [Algivirga pacifica]|uniref:Outer membrane protein beta-barrel domain-containing protein n=1 Tax=Algivirga pacifica TaxID=1162670 RepID=A0ABP9DLY9_9BACT